MMQCTPSEETLSLQRYLSAHGIFVRTPPKPKDYCEWFLNFPWQEYSNDKDTMRPWLVRFVESGYEEGLLTVHQTLYLIHALQPYYAKDVCSDERNRGAKFLDDLHYLLGGDGVVIRNKTGNPNIDDLADRIFSRATFSPPKPCEIARTGHGLHAKAGHIIGASDHAELLFLQFFILVTYDRNDVDCVLILDDLSDKWYIIALRDIDGACGLRLAKIFTNQDLLRFKQKCPQAEHIDEDDVTTWSPWVLFWHLQKTKRYGLPLGDKFKVFQRFRDQILC